MSTYLLGLSAMLQEPISRVLTWPYVVPLDTHRQRKQVKQIATSPEAGVRRWYRDSDGYWRIGEELEEKLVAILGSS